VSGQSVIFGIFITSLLTTGVVADSFRCDLEEVFALAADGTWEKHPLSKALLAQQVIADRASGTVYHPQFGNESYSTRLLLDEGSSHSSFKVIAYSDLGLPRVSGEKPFRNMTVFQVHTYVDSIEKPFVVMTSGSMGTGLCN
jgi:hypothetical protein